jgi:hypothetical protein
MFEKNLFQVEKMVKVQKVTELRAFTVYRVYLFTEGGGGRGKS